MRLLDIVLKSKHLGDLDLGNNPRMVIFHCMAENIGFSYMYLSQL